MVWKRSVELVQELYQEIGKLPQDEIYGLSSQMKRAAISIPSNIAEGQSRKNLKEFLQFLRIAYGSAAELETQIIITKNVFPKINLIKSGFILEEVQKMLNVLIRKLEPRN